MASEAEINQRIAQEQSKISVPSYSEVAWDGAWKRRSSAIWALGALGAVAGAGIGIAAAAAAVVGGVPLTGLLILKSAAMFSALGISGGMAAGIATGPSAGAASAVAKEMERRQLARDIDQAIRKDPEASVVLGEDVSLAEKPKKEFGAYYNPYTSLTFAAIGAVGGLIFAAAMASSGGAAAFVMPVMEVMLGKAAGAAAITAYSVGLGAAFGAFFGVNVPRVSRELIQLSGDMLSGKAIGKPWPESANLPEQKPILAPIISSPEKVEPTVSMEQPMEGKHCAACSKSKSKFENYEQLVTQCINEADAQLTR